MGGNVLRLHWLGRNASGTPSLPKCESTHCESRQNENLRLQIKAGDTIHINSYHSSICDPSVHKTLLWTGGGASEAAMKMHQTSKLKKIEELITSNNYERNSIQLE